MSDFITLNLSKEHSGMVATQMVIRQADINSVGIFPEYAVIYMVEDERFIVPLDEWERIKPILMPPPITSATINQIVRAWGDVDRASPISVAMPTSSQMITLLNLAKAVEKYLFPDRNGM